MQEQPSFYGFPVCSCSLFSEQYSSRKEDRRISADYRLARFITPIFVICDIIALLLQAIGAVLVSTTEATDPDVASKLARGRDMAMAGIAVQMAAFGLFTIIAGRFQFTSKRFAHDVEMRLQMEPGDKKLATISGCPRKICTNWRAILYAINISCALILVSIYQLPSGNLAKAWGWIMVGPYADMIWIAGPFYFSYD